MRDAVIIINNFAVTIFFLRNKRKTNKKMLISLFSENFWEMIKDLQLQQIISVDA